MKVTSGITPRFGQLYQIKIRDYQPEPITRKPGGENIAPHYVQYKPMPPELSKLVDLGTDRLVLALQGHDHDVTQLEGGMVVTQPVLHDFQVRLQQLMKKMRDTLPKPANKHIVEESPVLKQRMEERRLNSKAELDALFEIPEQPYPVYVSYKENCKNSVVFDVPPCIKIGKNIISAPSELVQALGSFDKPRPLLTHQTPPQS